MDEPAARLIADGLPPEKQLHAHVSIDRFVMGWSWFKRDLYGRDHTQITNLKKSYVRPFASGMAHHWSSMTSIAASRG